MLHKPKILFLFILCVLVILGLWFYSLKLNLNKPTGDQGKFDLNLKEIFGDLGDAFKNIPPPPNLSASTTPATEQIIDTLADKLKQLENTSTADWLIYTNKELNFEFKYPKTWFIYDTDSLCINNPYAQKIDYGIILRSLQRPSECGFSGIGGGTMLSVLVDETIKSVNEWIDREKEEDPTKKVDYIKEIKIGETTGKEVKLSCDCVLGTDINRFVERNGKLYAFYISFENVNKEEYLLKTNQILSTFKFLK